MKLEFSVRGLLLLLISAAFVAYLPELFSGTSFLSHAEKIVEKCRNSSYVVGCYNNEVPKLMDEGLSMEESFEVTRIIQSLDQEFRYCHVLGHKLSAKETAKDPSRWKEVIARSPSGICSNGSIHGAFQERFRSESLPAGALESFKQELEGVCDARGTWRPTGLERGSCTHALGHLAMYVTQADIKASLSLCDELVPAWGDNSMRQLCYDGAFMQIFQPLEPDDFALIEGKEQTRQSIPSFCSSFESPYRSSCVSESAALFREDMKKTPEALLSHCGMLPSEEERVRCKRALVHYIVPQFNLDSERVAEYCSAFPEREQALCFDNAAARFIEVDWNNGKKAIDICSRAGAAKDSCYGELVQMAAYNYHRGSKEMRDLCNGLPSPWKERCSASQL